MRHQSSLLEMLRSIVVSGKFLLLSGVVLSLANLVTLSSSMILHFGRIVEILGVLGLELALVRVGTRAQHVLWKGTSQIHLRLDEGLRFLEVDFLGPRTRCSGILGLHLN